MTFETLIVEEDTHALSLTINRLPEKNSINITLLKEIHQALDQAEQNKSCSLIILKGQEGLFCTGMDFNEILSWKQQTDYSKKTFEWTSLYMHTLRRFATSSKVIISQLDGKVIAGGLGLVAASDYVIATERTEFKLTEALWELLPAMVAPYLIRRIGFQKAYEMTLTARTVPAAEALDWHLVDQINPRLDEALEDLTRRIHRLQGSTIQRLKAYFRGIWLIDEKTEANAIEETSRALQTQIVQENISNFVEHQKAPWQR